MIVTRKAIFAATILASLGLSTEAVGRRTVIDQGQFLPTTTEIDPCTIGVACTAITLPFSFDFGTGSTDQAFVYSNGVVSFGEQIPLGVPNNADLTDLGVPVIAPLYLPGTTGTAGPYEAFIGTMAAGSFPTTLPPFGSEDMFVISFLNPNDDPDDSNFLSPYINLILDPSATSLQFEFIHGQSFFSDGVNTIELPDTTGTQLGYSLGNPLHPEQVLNDPPNIEGINAFTFPSGVPEPTSWAMMLLGFGAVGFALRRAKAVVAPSQFA